MDVADDTAKTPISTLRRRNSIGTPSALNIHTKYHQHYPASSSSSTSSSTSTTAAAAAAIITSSSLPSSYASLADFELVSLKPASYTSLRDILPPTTTAVQSPRVPSFAVHSGNEISIRNRLVKQAAWAYLQPMSTYPDSGGSTVFHRLWTRFSDAFLRLVTQIYNCLLGVIQITTTSSRS